MDTFSTDYISNIPMGLTSNIVRSVPRNKVVAVKTVSYHPRHKKKVKDIQKILIKLASLLSKIN